MTKLKEMQKDAIVSIATQLFLDKSIEEVKMSDLARTMGIGEMTLYRYFGTKQTLVLLCAVKMANLAMKYYDDHFTKGIDLMKSFFNSFVICFEKSPSYYRFIKDLDAYIKKERVKLEDSKAYNEQLLQYQIVFNDIYQKGLNDGTIKAIDNLELFYYTSMHAIMSLCKKLASQKDLLPIDDNINCVQEIKLLNQILLNYLGVENEKNK